MTKNIGRKVIIVLLIIILLAIPPTNAQWTRLWEYSKGVFEPTKRAAHSMVLLNDSVYIFGGVSDGNTDLDTSVEFSDTWKFDLVTNNWTKLANKSAVFPPPRFHHTAVIRSLESEGDNRDLVEMIVFGGLSINTTTFTTGKIELKQTNEIWRLTINTTEVDMIPSGNDSILVSNETKVRVENATWSLDEIDPTVDVPSPRSEATSVLYKNQIIIFGGVTYDVSEGKTATDYNDLWSYDLGLNEWTQIIPSDDVLPPARFSHSSTLIQKGEMTYLLVYSGRQMDEKGTEWRMLSDTWLFSFDTMKWMEVGMSKSASSSPVVRAYTSIVAASSNPNGFWFFGGYLKPEGSSNGYAFQDVVFGELTLKDMTSDQEDKTGVRYLHATAIANESSPQLRYNHRSVMWKNDCMVMYGGSFQTQWGDLWIFNTTAATLYEDKTSVWDTVIKLVVIVLGCLVVLAGLLLIYLLLKCRRQQEIHPEQLLLQLQQLHQQNQASRGVSMERLDQMGSFRYKKPKEEEKPKDKTHHQQEESQRSKRESEPQEYNSHASASGAAPSVSNEGDVCSICLMEFEESEEVRNLPCKHLFHIGCIDEWLQGNTCCPMCKRDLSGDIPSPTGESGATTTSLSRPTLALAVVSSRVLPMPIALVELPHGPVADAALASTGTVTFEEYHRTISAALSESYQSDNRRFMRSVSGVANNPSEASTTRPAEDFQASRTPFFHFHQ